MGQAHVAASDLMPVSADQFLVVGAEEGIYTLNLHELHEDTLEKVRLVGFGGRGTGCWLLTTCLLSLVPAHFPALLLALLCEQCVAVTLR